MPPLIPTSSVSYVELLPFVGTGSTRNTDRLAVDDGFATPCLRTGDGGKMDGVHSSLSGNREISVFRALGLKKILATKDKKPVMSGHLSVDGVLAEQAGWFDEQHYLGAGRPVGDYLRQVVRRRGVVVALLVWGPACYALKDRDLWIGWSANQWVERFGYAPVLAEPFAASLTRKCQRTRKRDALTSTESR